MEKYKQHEIYIEKFYESSFTAYDFIFLFSALYISQKDFSFNTDDLLNFIGICKKESKFDNLLNDINLKNNGLVDYSLEFYEAITKLKLAKILYTISPEKDATIYIFENIPVMGIIGARKAYLDEMICFIKEYKTHEFRNNPKADKTINFEMKTTFE